MLQLLRAVLGIKIFNDKRVLWPKSTETHSCNQSYVLDYNRLPNKQVISLPCSHKDSHSRQTRTAVKSSPFMELQGHVNSCCFTVLDHRAESWIEKVCQSVMIEAVIQDFGIFREVERRFCRIICNQCNLRLIGRELSCKDRNLIFSTVSQMIFLFIAFLMRTQYATR